MRITYRAFVVWLTLKLVTQTISGLSIGGNADA